MIETWWGSLDLFMKVIWCVTLCASLIFLIQSIMTFVGIGGDADLDASADADFGDGADPGMNLYTFRNLVNFLLGFGWTAIVCTGKIKSTALLVVVSVLAGAVLVVLVMLLFKWLYGMQQSGNIDVLRLASGCEGTVYLTIPAAREGKGKVQITIQNSVREYDAVTDGGEIKTGSAIRVKEALNDTTLVVEEVK